ncbi:MAG: DUF6051 family protein [Prolixibacteraceae bacterium]|nr:DUF6051 family protein [Prolixibacteraceae bacterium]
MTEVTKAFNKLKELFVDHGEIINQLGSISIKEYEFDSECILQPDIHDINNGDLYYHEMIGKSFSENQYFSYPVFYPTAEKKYSNGIFLFHGLNEKSWDKYLLWAAQLAFRMKRPVILFPIAYHINRAPRKWADPRMMKGAVQSREKLFEKNNTTFANAAMSIRLSACPEQFIYSGVQTFYDVRKLGLQIRDGKHPLFEKEAKLDVFAYSIGAFLSEILFVSNPDNLFAHSKLFIFAGGPTFDSMRGTSRYIMDLMAFRSLLTLKRKKKLKQVFHYLKSLELPDFDNTWAGFYAMMYMGEGRKYRNDWLNRRSGDLWIVALKKDCVMPAKKIIKTYKRNDKEHQPRIDVVDFPYPYTHENPFPFNDKKNLGLVLRSLNLVIDKAAMFYQSSLLIETRDHPLGLRKSPLIV